MNGSSKRLNENVINKSSDDGMLFEKGDRVLFDTITEYMKGKLDLEEVKNDPELSKIESTVKEMISDYKNNKEKNECNEKFVLDNLYERTSHDKLMDEINDIKYDLGHSNINDISAEWVEEWHKKRQTNSVPDAKSEGIKNFIKSSFENKYSASEIQINNTEKKIGLTRPLILRIISFSAAAVLGILIIVRSLLPDYNQDKLFNSFYKPFDAVSPVIRSSSNNEPGIYTMAIEKYKLGDYQTAALGFSEIIIKDSSSIAPKFFLGVTQIALANYDKAISYLSDVAGRSGEFGKEAKWYLGLAYLKNSEKENAIKCFEFLAKTPGFYQERSENILRRIK
jgi:TolA-binding protein